MTTIKILLKNLKGQQFEISVKREKMMDDINKFLLDEKLYNPHNHKILLLYEDKILSKNVDTIKEGDSIIYLYEKITKENKRPTHENMDAGSTIFGNIIRMMSNFEDRRYRPRHRPARDQIIPIDVGPLDSTGFIDFIQGSFGTTAESDNKEEKIDDVMNGIFGIISDLKESFNTSQTTPQLTPEDREKITQITDFTQCSFETATRLYFDHNKDVNMAIQTHLSINQLDY